jgi:hypothetical protein
VPTEGTAGRERPEMVTSRSATSSVPPVPFASGVPDPASEPLEAATWWLFRVVSFRHGSEMIVTRALLNTEVCKPLGFAAFYVVRDRVRDYQQLSDWFLRGIEEPIGTRPARHPLRKTGVLPQYAGTRHISLAWGSQRVFRVGGGYCRRACGITVTSHWSRVAGTAGLHSTRQRRKPRSTTNWSPARGVTDGPLEQFT